MIGRLLPVIIFLALGILLAFGLKIADKKTEIPSPLIGREMPKFTLPLPSEFDRSGHLGCLFEARRHCMTFIDYEHAELIKSQTRLSIVAGPSQALL